MNKKIIIPIISIIVLIAGIIFWQYSGQNIDRQSLSKNNNSAVCNSTICNEPQKIEKNLVEIFYLPHPPVDPIREKIKDILQKFPDYKLKEYNFYDENDKQKVEDYNLTGHIPIAIFINGKDTFLIDGQEITFKNFPKGDAFVPTLEGLWNYKDLEKVISNPDKYK